MFAAENFGFLWNPFEKFRQLTSVKLLLQRLQHRDRREILSVKKRQRFKIGERLDCGFVILIRKAPVCGWEENSACGCFAPRPMPWPSDPQ
jgi:hypothetical protein